MLDDIYPVVSFDNFLTYKFKSIGPNGVIEKVVRYREYGSPGIFNLGFGDVCPKTNFEDDLQLQIMAIAKRY